MRLTGTLAGAAALSLVLGLTACAPGQQEDPATTGGGKPASAQELRGAEISYLYFTDGPDEQATRDLIAKFEQQTGAKVSLQLIAFADLEKTLQARLSGGNTPDVARTNDVNPYRADLLDLRPYLKNPAFAEEFLPDPARPVRGRAGELLGVPSDLTVNGPFVNVELFERAGVPVPARDGKWTWDEMATAAEQVRKATGKPYAIAMDKSGHRVAGMLNSYGTTPFDQDGKPALDLAKTTTALQKFVGLHATDTMPKDFWIQSGSKYKGANEIFLAQDAAVYLSGNWQVSQFATGAKFRWSAVPNPCAERCGGFPGGKFMISFKQSKHPAAAAAFIEWMNSAEQQAEFAGRSQLLPTRKDLVAKGISYPQRAEDMGVFLNDLKLIPPAAYVSIHSPAFSRTANAIRDEAAKAIAGQASAADTAKVVKQLSEQVYQEVGAK